MRISDWSSDVCSSDLADREADFARAVLVGSAGAVRAAGQRRRKPDRQLARGAVDAARPADRRDARSDRAGFTHGPADPGRTRDARAVHQRRRHGDGRRGRSDEHTSELQSLMRISYAVSCLKKKTIKSLGLYMSHILL